MDGGAWRAAVHGVAKSRRRLSDFTFTFTIYKGLKSSVSGTESEANISTGGTTREAGGISLTSELNKCIFLITV